MINDALAADCHVLVHPDLAKRLPLEIKKECVFCHPDDRNSLHQAELKLCQAPVPSEV